MVGTLDQHNVGYGGHFVTMSLNIYEYPFHLILVFI
jgi:hypothetical protein